MVATAGIAAEYGSFSRIRQVATPLFSTWFFGLTKVLSSDGVSIGSAAFAGFTVTNTHASQRTTHFSSDEMRSVSWDEVR